MSCYTLKLEMYLKCWNGLKKKMYLEFWNVWNEGNTPFVPEKESISKFFVPKKRPISFDGIIK